jgi:ribosomal protein S18 acetylase RimI-like enzyme
MAVSILARSDTLQDGLQPFNPRRHLGEVADLVGRVFADELDARGRSAVREMQAAGRLGPLLGELMHSALFEDMISGYVYLAGGHVVGNVTIQPVDHGGLRWRISNVAVGPEHRGRGIARTLMTAALREIAQRGGAWSILQVRSDNPAARNLYDALGFAPITGDGLWRLPVLPATLPEIEGTEGLQPLRAAAWRARYELAKAIQTPLEVWAEPIRSEQFRIGGLAQMGEMLGRMIGVWRVERWAAWRGGEMVGMVETRAGPVAPFTLRFLVRPDARGTLEASLIERGLRSLIPSGRGPAEVEHKADHVEGVAALEAAGFQPLRVLVTMRRRMSPADREL